jgi:hypothetical protein
MIAGSNKDCTPRRGLSVHASPFASRLSEHEAAPLPVFLGGPAFTHIGKSLYRYEAATFHSTSASPCSDSESRFGLQCVPRQMKLSFDAGDRRRRHKLAVDVKDKEIAWPVEDDAAARPVFVFIRPHEGAQRGIQCPVTSPLRPCFVMARAVGQTIAVRLGLVQRTSYGEQLRFAVTFVPARKFRRATSRAERWRSCCHQAFRAAELFRRLAVLC